VAFPAAADAVVVDASLPRRPPDCEHRLFVSTQLTWQAVQLLESVGGGRQIRASMPPFNKKGKGLPQFEALSEVSKDVITLDAPCYGVRITEAIMELFSLPGLQEQARKLRVPIPFCQLNRVAQRKLEGHVNNIVKTAQGMKRFSAGRNAKALGTLQAFTEKITGLTPEATECQSMGEWKKFVYRYASEGWEDRLHINDVLLNFGFDDADAEDLRDKCDSKALRWLSKAFSIYGFPGSPADVVNLAFAMTGSRAPSNRPVSQDNVMAVLTRLKCSLQQIQPDPEGLWIPSIFIHDSEMDDIMSWLVLRHVHEERKTKLYVYTSLPTGDDMNVIEGQLSHFCEYVDRDPESCNKQSILEYFTSKTLPDRLTKPWSDLVPQPVLQYDITKKFVGAWFERDRGVPTTYRVELIKYDRTDPVLGNVSACCALLERKMTGPAFQPQGFRADSATKDAALRKMDECIQTDRFSRGSQGPFDRIKLVLAWHGCKPSLVESIVHNGFCAFGDLDDGWFGSGTYTALEAPYACGYAQGLFDPSNAHQYRNRDGECAVFLVACAVGFAYPVTLCEGDNGDFLRLPQNHEADCKWFGKPLKSRYNAHLIAVDPSKGYFCGHERRGSVHELVLKADDQLLPLAVVWFKP